MLGDQGESPSAKMDTRADANLPEGGDEEWRKAIVIPSFGIGGVGSDWHDEGTSLRRASWAGDAFGADSKLNSEANDREVCADSRFNHRLRLAASPPYFIGISVLASLPICSSSSAAITFSHLALSCARRVPI